MSIISPKRFKGAILFICKLLILAVPAGSFLYLVLSYYPETDFWFKGFLVFEFLYVSIFLMFASIYRCFRIGTLRFREIIFAYYLDTFLTNFIIYFVLSLSAKMLLAPAPLLIMMLVQWAAGSILYIVVDRLYFVLYPARDSAVVCSDDRREAGTLQKLASMQERYKICAVCSETDGYDAIIAAIRPYSTVFVGEVARGLRLQLMDYCFEQDKRLLVMPTICDIIFHNAHETFIGDSLVYLCRNRTFSLEQLIIKRLMDIVVSLVGIVLTSPIMFFTAMLIKLQDGGPILFKQIRYTRNLEQFELLKFRSMVVDAEKDGARFTMPGDKRITPFGRFIRRTRIDELPQFFNILHGEMSLVGPRAERIENVDYYCEILPEFRYRMKVKAGLTGYAQIYGKYNTSYEDKLKMDMLYIENCSLVRDLQILFQTFSVLFIPESTEGFQVESLSEMDRLDALREEEAARKLAEEQLQQSAAQEQTADGPDVVDDETRGGRKVS